MKALDQYPPSELKHIYRALHARLQHDPELMDSGLLHDLQRWLQAGAAAEGIDVSDHAAWATWLNDGTPVDCTEQR